MQIVKPSGIEIVLREFVRNDVLLMETQETDVIHDNISTIATTESCKNPYNFTNVSELDVIELLTTKNTVTCENRNTYTSVAILKKFHDIVLPRNSAHDLTYDSYIVDNEPMVIEVDNIIMTMSKRTPEFKLI